MGGEGGTPRQWERVWNISVYGRLAGYYEEAVYDLMCNVGIHMDVHICECTTSFLVFFFYFYSSVYYPVKIRKKPVAPSSQGTLLACLLPSVVPVPLPTKPTSS